MCGYAVAIPLLFFGGQMHALTRHIAKDGFRLRGTEMSRVDGFSDVVFGFALTLLVVSLEVPKTYDELHHLMLGFFPFAISFTFLLLIWMEHFQFFRRFGLHDTGTISLNATLLFVLLFYVYPLKFLFSMVVGVGSEADGHPRFSDAHQIPELMILYGLGFAAIYLLLAALYWNAYRQRETLELTAVERYQTRHWIIDEAGTGLVGLLSCVVATILPPQQAGLAGFVYMLIGPFKWIHESYAGRKAREMREAETQAKVDSLT